jgi:bla regulator protein blaR1
VEAVFWFHPLVWWIGGQLLEERERACDEGVLTVGNAPGDYAEGILAVCKSYVESPLRCVSGVTGADLKKRIQAILTGRIPEGLSLSRKTALVVAGLAAVASPLMIGALTAPALRAQPSVRPQFEVASIKPCERDGGRNMKMGPPGGSPVVSPGRLNTGCAALAGAYPTSGLIQRAYGGLKLGGPPPLGSALPVSGGPAWIYSDYYRINAEAADRAGEKTMEGPMLQALLEDRFKLRVHRETREVPVYALTVARGGPKLKAGDETCIQPDYSTYPMPALPPGKTYCEPSGVGWRNGENLKLNAEPETVDYFCKLLGLVLDRPTVDRTGLPGKYAFHLKFAIDQSMHEIPEGFGPHSDEPPAPSIFTAVQEQLGLKLEPSKGPREFLVIDHVERPSEN